MRRTRYGWIVFSNGFGFLVQRKTYNKLSRKTTKPYTSYCNGKNIILFSVVVTLVQVVCFIRIALGGATILSRSPRNIRDYGTQYIIYLPETARQTKWLPLFTRQIIVRTVYVSCENTAAHRWSSETKSLNKFYVCTTISCIGIMFVCLLNGCDTAF